MKQRQAVTAVTVERYRQGSKKVKQQILNEFCETTGYHWAINAFLRPTFLNTTNKKKEAVNE